jgi:hypothetical protein
MAGGFDGMRVITSSRLALEPLYSSRALSRYVMRVLNL